MKTITLTQPWATLCAIGAKRIETRSWRTSYRGPLAIHAAKGYPKWAKEFSLQPVCYEAVEKLGYKSREWFPSYPTGSVLATTTLIDCVEMRELHYTLDYTMDGNPSGIIGEYTGMLVDRPMEREFGDYSVGRFAWILGPVECFRHPIPAKGSLGLWEWSPPLDK